MSKNNLLKTLIITFTLVSISSNAYSEDLITNREIKPNSVLIDIDFSKGKSTTFLFGLEYLHNLDKNFSFGASVETLFLLINNFNISGRYYFDWLNDKRTSFYAKANLGYYSITQPQTTNNSINEYSSFLNLNPSIGYEFRADNGFIINAEVGPNFYYGISQNTNGFITDPIKAGVKIGYSF